MRGLGSQWFSYKMNNRQPLPLKKNQNPGSRFGVTYKTALPIKPNTAKMGQMGRIGSAV
jgi:hypothetical protein